MFSELWRIAQTDQVLKQYHLDSPEYLEKSRLGASLLMALYTDLSVAKATTGMLVLPWIITNCVLRLVINHILRQNSVQK